MFGRGRIGQAGLSQSCKVTLRILRQIGLVFRRIIAGLYRLPECKFDGIGAGRDGRTLVNCQVNALIRRRGPSLRQFSDSIRIETDAKYTHRTNNVFDVMLTEVLELIIHTVTQVIPHTPRYTDATRLSNRLEARGNIDAVAEDASLTMTSPTLIPIRNDILLSSGRSEFALASAC